MQGRGGCEGAARPAAGGAACPAVARPRGLRLLQAAAALGRLLLGAAALGAAPAGHRLLGGRRRRPRPLGSSAAPQAAWYEQMGTILVTRGRRDKADGGRGKSVQPC